MSMTLREFAIQMMTKADGDVDIAVGLMIDEVSVYPETYRDIINSLAGVAFRQECSLIRRISRDVILENRPLADRDIWADDAVSPDLDRSGEP